MYSRWDGTCSRCSAVHGQAIKEYSQCTARYSFDGVLPIMMPLLTGHSTCLSKSGQWTFDDVSPMILQKDTLHRDTIMLSAFTKLEECTSRRSCNHILQELEYQTRICYDIWTRQICDLQYEYCKTAGSCRCGGQGNVLKTCSKILYRGLCNQNSRRLMLNTAPLSYP